MHGETLGSIARRTLGPNVKDDDVDRYVQVIAEINNISNPRLLQTGDDHKLLLPGYNSDGSITITNPTNPVEHWAYHRDGSLEHSNDFTGTSVNHLDLDKYGSYQEHVKTSQPADDYVHTYVNKEHYDQITRTNADGSSVTTGADGVQKKTDRDGNWVTTYPPDRTLSTCSYDKASGVRTDQYRDGSTIKFFEKDNHTEAVDADGTRTTKWADSSLKVEKKDAEGHETGLERRPDGHGGYHEHGFGPQPKDNYDETYSAQTGTTIRVEGKGTPEETKTTQSKDGVVKVEAKNGNNYQRNPDGSEHHWGKENYDKPAYDFQHDKQLGQSREALIKSVHDHLPAEKQAAFRQDMTDFEARAKKDHLSPEEVAITYGQITRMLDTPEGNAVVSGANRSLLAEGLMHQCAHPGDTNQGAHNTCNVTTVLNQTLAKNPSAAAEMAATTAVTGQWTAPDGHAAQIASISKESLQPQVEESVYPPNTSGDRSYATQVLNLAMANDQLQRRSPPQYYVQQTPDGAVPDDTGERLLDSSKNPIYTLQHNDAKDTWLSQPVQNPSLTEHELAQLGTRLNGKSHVLDFNDGAGNVDSINSEQVLAHQLHQLKQQGELPLILSVDGHHTPIQEVGRQSPAYGSHYVTLDDYDPRTGRVHVSNQWGKKSNKWVTVQDLYRNASGEYASNQDGVNLSDYE